MVIYVTQGRLYTVIEIRHEQTTYPAHLSIYQCLERHTYGTVTSIFIADLRSVLLKKEALEIAKLFPKANVYHCGLRQPAHSIMTHGDKAEVKLIANDFGTAGEVITLIRKNKIIKQERGYRNSLGLLLAFTSEYLSIPECEIRSASYEYDQDLIKSYKSLPINDAFKSEIIETQMNLYEWYEHNFHTQNIIDFVNSYIEHTITKLGISSEVSLYGRVFSRPPYLSNHTSDTIIPKRMHTCMKNLKKLKRLNALW